jgi:CRISPR-associated protein Cmr6
MRKAIIDLSDRRGKSGRHPGLLLQRYLCENATGDGGNPEEKRAIMLAAINAAIHQDVQDLYRCAFDRWKASLPSEPAPIELATQGRLIVGLGSENVLETGIRLHHTYGMPIIPGSALKGLAAHYCDQAWGPSDEKFRKSGLYHQLLFGKTDDSGCIVFHDSWYVPGSEEEPLKLDVMTPHHSGWNKVENPEPPTDFDSPIPVPFLSVAGRFLISVSWHGPEHKEAIAWTNLAMDILRNALFDWGVGGKTSSGYGRLQSPPPPPPPAPFNGKSGESVDAVLLNEKTKKGLWRAQIQGHSQIGEIQNSNLIPIDAKAGDVVKLNLAYINVDKVSFKWPIPAKK